TALRVARLIEGMEHLLAELSRVGEDVVDKLCRQVGKSRQVAVLVHLQHLVDQEAVILNGGAIDGHGTVLQGGGFSLNPASAAWPMVRAQGQWRAQKRGRAPSWRVRPLQG